MTALLVAGCLAIATAADPVAEAANHVRAGRPAHAILPLRSALAARPHDRAARDGLALIRQEVALGYAPTDAARVAPERDRYPPWLFAPAARTLSFLAWCGGWLAFLVAARMRRRAWWIAAAALGLIGALPAVNAIVLAARRSSDRAAPPAVVIHPTALREGNGPDYPIILPLAPGVECRRIGARGGFAHVRFAAGLTGWVAVDDLAVALTEPGR